MNIQKLIAKTAKGDKMAFETLYRETSQMVFAIALSTLKSRQDAEDIMTDTFISVWENAGGFNGGNGKSWLCSIAKNKSLNLIKKRNREVVGEISADACVNYGIEGSVENKIILETALSVLDEKERETVLLFNSGMKHREIAEIMNEKLGTVTWRYNNALAKMKRRLLSNNEK